MIKMSQTVVELGCDDAEDALWLDVVIERINNVRERLKDKPSHRRQKARLIKA